MQHTGIYPSAPQTKRPSFSNGAISTYSTDSTAASSCAKPLAGYAPSAYHRHYHPTYSQSQDSGEDNGGDMDVDNEDVPAYSQATTREHTFVGGKTYCGAQAPNDKPKDNFVTKLYRVVMSPHYTVIQWDQGSDERFVIFDQDVFVQTAMQQICQTNNFETFVRQLNMYGFKKIGRAPRGNQGAKADKRPLVFHHSEGLFKKGREDLLVQIERKHPGGNAAGEAATHQDQPQQQDVTPAIATVDASTLTAATHRGSVSAGSAVAAQSTSWQGAIQFFHHALQKLKEEHGQQIASLRQEVTTLQRDNSELRQEVQQLKSQQQTMGGGFDFLADPFLQFGSPSQPDSQSHFINPVTQSQQTFSDAAYNDYVKQSASPPPTTHAALTATPRIAATVSQSLSSTLQPQAQALSQAAASIAFQSQQQQQPQYGQSSAYQGSSTQQTINPSALVSSPSAAFGSSSTPTAYTNNNAVGNGPPSPVAAISHARGVGVAAVPPAQQNAPPRSFITPTSMLSRWAGSWNGSGASGS